MTVTVILLKHNIEWKFNPAEIGKDSLCHCNKFIFHPCIQNQKIWICQNCIKTDSGEKMSGKKKKWWETQKEREEWDTNKNESYNMLFTSNNFIFWNTWEEENPV